MSETYVLFELGVARGFAYLAALALHNPMSKMEITGKGYLKQEIERRMEGSASSLP